MNCKPGDLAVVVAGPYTPEMIGYVVRVVKPAVYGNEYSGVTFVKDNGEFAWVCEAVSKTIPQRTLKGKLLHVPIRPIQDRILRPLRDNEGEDETLIWAGKHQEVKA